MSSDNFIAIVKKGRSYIGYHCWASHNYPYVKCFACLGREKFKVTKLRQAMDLAQGEDTEYGYSFYNWVAEDFQACPCELRMLIFDGVE